MRLKPYSFYGTSIQDSTFAGYFAKPAVMLPASASPVYVARQAQAPRLTYKERQPRTLEMHVTILNTSAVDAGLNTLAALFNPNDMEDSGYGPGAHQLIATDSADSNKQYYVYASAIAFPQLDGQDATIQLAVADPVWATVTQTSTTQNITTSGTQWDVTVGGNVNTPPVIKITPNEAKEEFSALNSRRYVQVYNQAFYGVSGINAPAGFTNYPIDITNGGLDTAALVSDASNNCLLNGAVDDSVTTFTYDNVTGAIPSSGIGYVGTEQFTYTGKTATQLTGITRGVGGTTAASHLDNATVYVSYLLANGDDVQVLVDGSPVDRWFGTGTHAMNQSATQIWINIDLQNQGQASSATLRTAIAGAGSVSTISLTGNSWYERGDTSRWPFVTQGDTHAAPWPLAGRVLIGSEIFAYTSTDPPNLNLIGCTRSILGTSAAAHSIGDQVYLLEHEIYLVYGTPDASAPTVDDKKKPMFSLASSTNTSWVYTDFYDSASNRPGQWYPSVAASVATASARTSNYYTTSQNTTAVTNPAAVIGEKIGAWKSGSKWKADTGHIRWELNHPAGITTVSVSGYKFRSTGNTSWPSVADLLKARPGVGYTTIWTESAPAAGSWTALASHSSVSLSGTYNMLVWMFYGTQATKADAYCAMEATDVTLTLDSARVPSVTLGALITQDDGGYPLNATITNTETGEWVQVAYQMDVDETLQIDCENKTITYLKDNSPANARITFSSVREAWLDLIPGANTMQFDDDGTTDIDVVFLTKDKKNR